MATAQNIIDIAGNLLRIVDTPGAAVDATNSAAMLTQLASMIGSWHERGIVELPTPATLGATITESESACDGIALNLAVRCASLYGKQPDAWIIIEAGELKSYLRGRKTTKRELSLANDGMPGLSRGRFNMVTG